MTMSGVGHDDPDGDKGKHAAEFDLQEDPGQIFRLLLKAHQEEENVEVTINERTRTFFTYFIDHVPDPVGTPDEGTTGTDGTPNASGELSADPDGADQAPSEADGAEEVTTGGGNARPENYEPFSYLRARKYLLLAPLSPAVGNVQVRGSSEVSFRFFQGVKAMEGTVEFQEVVTVSGEPALKIGFPRSFRVYRKRRHFRARVTPEVQITLTIKARKAEPLVARLIDISVAGLAFCNPLGEEAFPVDSPVEITLETADMKGKLQLTGLIRNHARATKKEGCGKGDGRCGIQFDVLSTKMAMDVEGMTTYVQREFLQEVQEKKKGTSASHVPTSHDDGKKGDLNRLMSIKNAFRFK